MKFLLITYLENKHINLKNFSKTEQKNKYINACKNTVQFKTKTEKKYIND